MEAVIFIGPQAAGKSTFFRERFAGTHVRINLDTLRTRARERALLRTCLESRQPFVVDNTNPTAADRAGYLAAAHAAGFRATAYYFETPAAECRARNAARPQAERVPPVALIGTHRRLQPPTHAEGFDRIYRVRIPEAGAFEVEELDPAPAPPDAPPR